MEPAALLGLQMFVLEVPFALFPAAKPFQEVFAVRRGVFRVQLCQNMDILADFFPRDAQQALDVRADVIHLGGLCVQHQEHVVHVQRELLEQLVAVQDLGILPAQGGAVPVQDEQDDGGGKTGGDARYDLHRVEPQLVQTGVDDVDRHKPQHRPALHRRALVDQIITGVAQRYLPVSAAALRKIIRKRKDLLLGKVGIVAQHRNEVVDRFLAVYGIVDDDPSIIIIRDGNGIVGKAPVAALCFGTDEHKHLRLAGQCCVHHDILAIGELFVQIGLQAKVACFPVHGHVVAVIGKEVEVDKSDVLLRFLDIRLNGVRVRGAFQKAVVQVQIAHVLAHHLFQHIVGFVQHFFQMRGAFLIDGLRHEREILKAETDCQQDQKKDGSSREQFLPEMAVSVGFVLFVWHSVHLSVM